jgi:hypothetical protein
LGFRWKQRRLLRLYGPLMDKELNAKRREEIWLEYSHESNELSMQRRLRQDAQLQRKADRMRVPVPSLRDGSGNLTASYEQDYVGRISFRAEAYCRLQGLVRCESSAQRGELVKWISTVSKICNMVLFTANLLFLNASVSYGSWTDTDRQPVDQYYEPPEKAEDKDRVAQIGNVEVTVTYNREKCRAQDEPHMNAFQMLEAEKKALLVFIQNRSKYTSSKVKWSLAVRRKGHSDDLTDYRDLPSHQQSEFKRSNSFVSDKILRPGESDEQCYVLPYILGGYSPENLIYSVISKTVEFMK